MTTLCMCLVKHTVHAHSLQVVNNEGTPGYAWPSGVPPISGVERYTLTSIICTSTSSPSVMFT